MSAWKHVAGFKWTEFNSADKVIPFPLTLHLALMKAGANEGIKVKKVPSLMLAPIDNADNHNRFGGDRGGVGGGMRRRRPYTFNPLSLLLIILNPLSLLGRQLRAQLVRCPDPGSVLSFSRSLSLRWGVLPFLSLWHCL